MSGKGPAEGEGYRGALPPRSDWLARGWVLIVIAIFVSLFVLDILNVPTRFLPEPTPLPTPVISPAPSGSADPSADPSASPDASGSSAESPSEAESPSPTP